MWFQEDRSRRGACSGEGHVQERGVSRGGACPGKGRVQGREGSRRGACPAAGHVQEREGSSGEEEPLEQGRHYGQCQESNPDSSDVKAKLLTLYRHLPEDSVGVGIIKRGRKESSRGQHCAACYVMNVSPQNSDVGALPPKDDDIRRWGLWTVILGLPRWIRQ